MLEVRQLEVHWPAPRPSARTGDARIRAVDGVSFVLAPGESLGVVGESGCGKTTLARAVMRLIPATGGHILFDGEDLTHLSGRALRRHRHKFQMVFQDPQSSLNPQRTVGQTVEEALVIHRRTSGGEERRARVCALLERVGLSGADVHRYPHEFSGGQRQRIGIARALAVEPKLLVCDEPVSSLDVSVQAQIVNLLRDLQETQGLAYLFIAHDLALVEHLCHRVLVLSAGQVVETGEAHSVLRMPRHPYTQSLVAAMPTLEPAARRRVLPRGEPPSPTHPPSGCRFHPRCPLAEVKCRVEPPSLRSITAQQEVACHLAR